MKLDEDYRQKNGLGAAPPDPPPKRAKPRLTFDNNTAPEPTPAPPSNPDEVGFIDRLISEDKAPKKKKIKTKKPRKVRPDAARAASPPSAAVKPAKPPKVPKPPKPPKPPKKPPTQPSNLKTQLLTFLKVVIFVVLVVFSLYNYLEVQRLNDLINTDIGQPSQNQIKNQELIDKISAFRLLPEGEYEVYTVKDKSKLVNDPVFEYAQNGDKVIVYPDAPLTLVYRESEGKIIAESRDSSLTED